MLLDGKKISGSAQTLAKNRLLQHGTLLIASDLELLSGVLHVSPDKFQSKKCKSVRSRVTNIQDYVPFPIDIQGVKDLLIDYWSRGGAFENVQLDARALGQIESWPTKNTEVRNGISADPQNVIIKTGNDFWAER